MTGFIAAPYYDLRCVSGKGSIVVLSWDLSNGNVTCLTQYGVYGNDDGNVGGGVGYDSITGTMVVAGIVSGADASLYGDFDAVILMYHRNLTLMSATIIGS